MGFGIVGRQLLTMPCCETFGAFSSPGSMRSRRAGAQQTGSSSYRDQHNTNDPHHPYDFGIRHNTETLKLIPITKRYLSQDKAMLPLSQQCRIHSTRFIGLKGIWAWPYILPGVVKQSFSSSYSSFVRGSSQIILRSRCPNQASHWLSAEFKPLSAELS